jgi:hypothetical protein
LSPDERRVNLSDRLRQDRLEADRNTWTYRLLYVGKYMVEKRNYNVCGKF